MTKIATVRTLVTLPTIHGLVMHQIDVKIDFPNGDLEEEIYMFQSNRCVALGKRIKFLSLGNSFTSLNRPLNSGIKKNLTTL